MLKLTALIRRKSSYRTPMQVTRLFLHPVDGSFPICPRCNTPFEIEYQAYCGNCGQCLGWDTYIKIVEESNV